MEYTELAIAVYLEAEYQLEWQRLEKRSRTLVTEEFFLEGPFHRSHYFPMPSRFDFYGRTGEMRVRCFRRGLEPIRISHSRGHWLGLAFEAPRILRAECVRCGVSLSMSAEHPAREESAIFHFDRLACLP